MTKRNPRTFEQIETFKTMPDIRWIEEEEIMERSIDGNPISSITIKTLQQLHLGDMGTKQWRSIPTIK